MTKILKDYLISLVSVMGGLGILNSVRSVFEEIFKADLAMLRWGIWIVIGMAGAYFIWRGIDGIFYQKDFWVDEDKRRWR